MVTTDLITRPPSRSDDRGIHIVIAEENAITRRMIELGIARLGWTIDSADNGVEALSAVERTVDNLALALLQDVQMPQMAGLNWPKKSRVYPRWPVCWWS